MKFKLILLYNNSNQLELGCYSKLREIDNYTTQYKDSQDLLKGINHIISQNPAYKNILESLQTSNNHKLYIEFCDRGGYLKKINILYKENKTKLNPVNMYNDIIRYIQEDQSYLRAQQLLNKFIYMFNSEFNVKIKHIYTIQKNLNDPSSSIKNKEESLNNFIEIIKHDLIIQSNNKDYDHFKYTNLRVIDNYISNEKKDIILKKNSEEQNNRTTKNDTHTSDIDFEQFLDDVNKTKKNYTMSEIAYLFLEFLDYHHNYHNYCENKKEKRKKKYV